MGDRFEFAAWLRSEGVGTVDVYRPDQQEYDHDQKADADQS